MGTLRQSTQGQPSVLAGVLRAQARKRRLRRAGAAALTLALAALAGLWLSPSGRPSAAASPAVVERSRLAQTGAVTGYVRPCAGIGWPVDPSTGARVFSAAAVVEALPGLAHTQPGGPDPDQLVLPTAVAAREPVPQNEKFLLDQLAPGPYVILAHYAGSNATTFVEVIVAPGQVADVTLPDTCK